MSSIGFLFWSGFVPIAPLRFYLLGEIFHILGFILLVCGAYRFTGNSYEKWNIFAAALWGAVWIGSLLLTAKNVFLGSLLLKSLRAVLFISAGVVVLRNADEDSPVGRRLTGWSLVSWGVYVVSFSVIRLDVLLNMAFGFLVGFQLLSAIGMVVMVIDRMRIRAERTEKRMEKLEGLLPICSYCKKIRDRDNRWQVLELYIEERSKAEFSHGICPECLAKHHPNEYEHLMQAKKTI